MKSKFNLLKKNVMIDLETLASTPDSAILSIGACKFDHTGIVDTFYRNIKMSSANRYDLRIDPATIDWWADQLEMNGSSMDALFKNSIGLARALYEFNEWYGDSSLITWSKGSDFDLVIMRHAYEKVSDIDNLDIVQPWNFKHGLCFRTMMELFADFPGLKPEFTGTVHNALDDAKWQSQYLINIWNAWSVVEESC